MFNVGQTARCDHVADLSPLRQRYAAKLGTELYGRAVSVEGRMDDNERAVVRKIVGYFHDYTETCVVDALPRETWLYYQLFARSFGQIASSITLGQIGTAATIASVAFQGGRHVNGLRREWNKQKAKAAEKEAHKVAEKKEHRERQHVAGHGGEVPLQMRHAQRNYQSQMSDNIRQQHETKQQQQAGHEQQQQQQQRHQQPDSGEKRKAHKSSDE